MENKVSYKINYFYKAKKDLLKFDLPQLLIIKRFIEMKLTNNPIRLGKTLSGNLKNFKSVRLGDYRIIYKVLDDSITIFMIGLRKDVYIKAKKRLGID